MMRARRTAAKAVRGAGLGSWSEGFEERVAGGKVKRAVTRAVGEDATAEEGGQGRLECTSRVCEREGCSRKRLEAHLAMR